MSTTDSLDALADFLWEFLTDQPPSAEEQQEQLTERLVNALEDAGFRGISNADLADALGEVQNRLTEVNQEGMANLSIEMNSNLHDVSLDLASTLSQDFDAGIEASMHQLRVEQIEPLKVAIANQPAPVINQVTHRHVTNVTNVDDRQIVNTNNVVHDGGVLDQRIVQGDDGAVVAGGDINDSAVNTGTLDGVQAGGDVDVEDSIVGDGNTAVIDSDADAIAVGGDAISIDAEPAPAPVVEEPAADAFEDAAAAEAEAAALEAELDV